jgi:membrane protease YdiL (CAAX protease family)
MSEHEPQPARQAPAGLITALLCAALLIAAFVLESAAIRMPPAERWAALTTFGLLALLYTLQGSPEVYDMLGRTVQRDLRAWGTLLLVIPVLYSSYSMMVEEFRWSDLLTSLAFVLLPALAFSQSRRQRIPTLFDVVAVLYLLLSLTLGLLPDLTLPQQGGIIGFFAFSAAPLLLLLLAGRGWPGLGFTWFLSWSDLRVALLGAAALLAVLASAALAAGVVEPSGSAPAVLDELMQAVLIYFLIALPQEILFRGLIQNGIARFAEARLWRPPDTREPEKEKLAILRQPQLISLVSTALIVGAAVLYNPVSLPANPLLAFIAALGYGWVYQRTGKVTASAVTHLLVAWCWAILFLV